ncbi:MAG: sucrase ferredoxin [Actinomycetes bacterium]
MRSPVLDGTCSAAARDLDEPLAGTAPVAPAWLVVEQPGPWGRDALTQSHLDAGVAATLAARAEPLPVRVLLVRRPGPHPDDHHPTPRTVWTASTVPGATWLRRHRVEDPRALLDVDLDALAAGRPEGGEPEAGPVVFVCTNGRRDRCCALRGRDLAAALAARLGDGRVWECSHLGGHRFAPTALVLPHGVVHGRLDARSAAHVVDQAEQGRLALDGYRGRSTWDRPGQVAEAVVRTRTGLTGLDDLHVGSLSPAPDGAPGPVSVPVSARDGRRWTVTVDEREGPTRRPESCERPETPLRWLEAVTMVPQG